MVKVEKKNRAQCVAKRLNRSEFLNHLCNITSVNKNVVRTVRSLYKVMAIQCSDVYFVLYKPKSDLSLISLLDNRDSYVESVFETVCKVV